MTGFVSAPGNNRQDAQELVLNGIRYKGRVYVDVQDTVGALYAAGHREIAADLLRWLAKWEAMFSRSVR